MAEQRLPTVSGDDGTWGGILNQFIGTGHYNSDPIYTQGSSFNGKHAWVNIVASDLSGNTPSGTASGAPLKFTSGPLLGTPQAGAIEFLTDDLYFTQTTGTTRKKITTYDTNANVKVNNVIESYTGSAGATVTLTVASAFQQYCTGSTSQTVNMPDTSTLVVGQQWQITSKVPATYTVTIKTTGGTNLLVVLGPGASATLTCVSIANNNAASWSVFCGQNITVSAGTPGWTPNVGDIWIDIS